MGIGPPLRRGAWVGGLLVLLYALSVGAVLYRPDSSVVATWWPAAGVSAALLVLGWPGSRTRLLLALAVTLVSGLANLTAGRSPMLALLFGLANGAEAWLIGAVMTRRPLPRSGLQTPDDFFRLIAACTSGALAAGAGIGLGVGLVGGDVLVAVRSVTPSHLASTLVILPLALSVHAGHELLRTRLPELVLQAVLLGGALLLVFGPESRLTMAFLPLPLLLWAALRFGTLVTSLQLLTLGAISTVSTASGSGPFSGTTPAGTLDPATATMQVQSLLVCAALLTFPPALAIAQRATLLRRLRDEQELVTTTLESTAALIVMTEPDGTVLRVNATTTRLTGFEAAEMVGRPFWETPIIPGERRALVRAMYDAADGSSVVPTREADVMTATGERLRIIWNNNVVRAPDGEVIHVVSTGTDVTSERSTTAMLRHLLEAPVTTALVGLDERGHITVFNQGAQELLHRSPQDVLGRPISEIVETSQAETYMATVDARERVGGEDDEATPLGPQTSDWTWRDHRGGLLTVSTTISVVENAVGSTMGYLCVGRDVTDQRRTQEILVEALEKERHGVERLQRLDAAKNDFVSTVSHELRTPTTSIVGYTEMLRDGSAGEPTPEQLLMLDAIARNGERLIAVAGDLLTLAELESGDTSQWEREPVDLAVVVGQCEEAVRPLVKDRELDVSFQVPGEPVVVIGDAGHLDRVLMNLLSNAVKFTPDGGRVDCRLTSSPGWAQVEVSDTGIGIPSTEQAELFTKFFRSSTAQEHAIQGTGLGLSIIDSIVAAHGGEISVSSVHEQGSVFTVRLPARRRAKPTGQPEPQPGEVTVRTG